LYQNALKPSGSQDLPRATGGAHRPQTPSWLQGVRPQERERRKGRGKEGGKEREMEISIINVILIF